MLGLDISKDTLAATLIDPVTRQAVWEQTVPNTPTGVRRLLRRTDPQIPWVLEPTGRYGLDVAKQAREAARAVLLAPPKKAKAFLAAIQSRAKTDRLDSRGLALYAVAVPLKPYPIKSDAVEQLSQLLNARKGMAHAIASLTQQMADLPYAAESLRPAVAALVAQRDALDAQIAALTADQDAFPAVAALDAVPGIGPVTAAAVGACLAAKPFVDADAFVAYVGLDTRVRDSGRRAGHRTLTKHGDAELRRLLYLCAQANLRTTDSPFKAQYAHERDKGLTSTAALCAVARKLARLCWSLTAHKTTYNPDRVNHQPNRLREVPDC